MKKFEIIPGLLYRMIERHNVLIAVLRARQQTQAEAAAALDVSLSYFNSLVCCRHIPDFTSEWGKRLAEKLFEWSGGFSWEEIFPEAFFHQEFLDAPKVHEKVVPFRLLMQGGDLTLALPAPKPAKTSEPPPASKKRRRRTRRKL